MNKQLKEKDCIINEYKKIIDDKEINKQIIEEGRLRSIDFDSSEYKQKATNKIIEKLKNQKKC